VTAPAPIGRRIVSALAGALVAALLAWGAWQAFKAASSRPVTEVAFAGEVERLARADLEALAAALRAAPPATLEEIRAAARSVAWVRDATVRRALPGAVEITFDAHEAFARWNDGELVNAEGEVFAASRAGFATLPQLRGPDNSAARVVEEYRRASAVLAPLGEPVAELRLSPRGAWHAVLASGLTIALGRGDWRPRAERFVAAWPKLDPAARAARYADLRYPGGFALKRAATLTPIPAPERGRKP
jgi:cell division protein FtsQ